MGALFLTDMADVLRAGDVTDVNEYTGWRTRARGSGGYDPGRPWCVFWHHTASSSSAKAAADYCTIYNPYAPVANIVLGSLGEVWVCAAGATNTEGKGGPQTFSKGTIPKDSANAYAISIEAVNSGVGQIWSEEQIDQYFRINTALTKAYGLLPTDCASHASWTPGRKIDPATAAAVRGLWQPRSINSSGTWNLDDMRAEAQRRAGSTPVPPTPSEDDMTPRNERIVDTRSGKGGGKFGANSARRIKVPYPATQAFVHLIALNASAPGVFIIGGVKKPDTSALGFGTSGQTECTCFTGVDPDGTFQVWCDGGSADLVIDLQGTG